MGLLNLRRLTVELISGKNGVQRSLSFKYKEDEIKTRKESRLTDTEVKWWRCRTQ